MAFNLLTRGPTDMREPGAGLSLAIVRAVAEAHAEGASGENRGNDEARVTLTLGA